MDHSVILGGNMVSGHMMDTQVLGYCTRAPVGPSPDQYRGLPPGRKQWEE